MTPVSLPMWILLIVAIGAPVHILVNKGIAHWRKNYEISSIATMTLVMLACLILLPLLHGIGLPPLKVAQKLVFATIVGLLFGTPIGLLARAMIGSERSTTPSL